MSNRKRKKKQTTIYLDNASKRKAYSEANRLGLSFSGYLRYLINCGDESDPVMEITIGEDGNKTYSLASNSISELSSEVK